MEKVQNEFFSSLIKAVLLAVISMLAGVLIFGVVTYFAGLKGSVIKAVNQFIKVLSVFLGCFFFIKGKAGLIKGLLVGIISTLVTFLVFTVFGVKPTFNLSLIVEFVFLGVVGAICGIISVNLKQDR